MNVVTPNSIQTEAINAVANQEVKALSYVALFDNGALTATSLRDIVIEQTSVDECYGMVKSYPETFENSELATHRIAKGKNGRDARYFSVLQQVEVLPIVGTLLEWGNEHDIPLVKMLSTTASKGDGRAPLNSIQIFDGLLQGCNVVSKMPLPGYELDAEGRATGHNTRLFTLVEDGIVTAIDDPNEFTIDNPEYRGSTPIEQLAPMSRYAYELLAKAKDVTAGPWTIEKLIEVAKLDMPGLDEESLAELNRVLVRGASLATPKYLPGAIIKIEFKPRVHEICDAYVLPAADLVERIKVVIGNDTKAKSDMADAALDLLYHQDSAFKLATRAVLNSPYIKQ